MEPNPSPTMLERSSVEKDKKYILQLARGLPPPLPARNLSKSARTHRERSFALLRSSRLPTQLS